MKYILSPYMYINEYNVYEFVEYYINVLCFKYMLNEKYKDSIVLPNITLFDSNESINDKLYEYNNIDNTNIIKFNLFGNQKPDRFFRTDANIFESHRKVVKEFLSDKIPHVLPKYDEMHQCNGIIISLLNNYYQDAQWKINKNIEDMSNNYINETFSNKNFISIFVGSHDITNNNYKIEKNKFGFYDWYPELERNITIIDKFLDNVDIKNIFISGRTQSDINKFVIKFKQISKYKNLNIKSHNKSNNTIDYYKNLLSSLLIIGKSDHIFKTPSLFPIIGQLIYNNQNQTYMV